MAIFRMPAQQVFLFSSSQDVLKVANTNSPTALGFQGNMEM